MSSPRDKRVERLLAAIGRGKEKAVGALARLYRDELMRSLQQRYQIPELIEDVVRETLETMSEELRRGNVPDREALEHDLGWIADRLASAWLVLRVGRGDPDSERELVRVYDTELCSLLDHRYRGCLIGPRELKPNLLATVQAALTTVLEQLREGMLKDPETLRIVVYETLDRLEPRLLVERIARGNQTAEAQLAFACKSGLHFILTKRYPNWPEMVDDVVQDTLEAMVVNLRRGKLKKPAALQAYVLTIAHNKANEHMRGDYRNGSPVDPAEFEHLVGGYDAMTKLAITELAELVKQVIDELPVERDRKLIWRFYYYQVGKAVLCEQFGITPVHFDRVHFRAKKRLKELVEQRIGGSLGDMCF